MFTGRLDLAKHMNSYKFSKRICSTTYEYSGICKDILTLTIAIYSTFIKYRLYPKIASIVCMPGRYIELDQQYLYEEEKIHAASYSRTHRVPRVPYIDTLR